jgi:hypothetical protein
VTDVTALNGQPNDDKVPGINAAGEVVGSFEVGVKWHAFVWLPVANPNYPALSVGLNDLHVLAGLGPDDQSAARSINDAGQVAGQVGFNVSINNGRAIVLDLTQPAVSVIDVPVPTQNVSGARAINNANPFQVVGHFGSTDICIQNEVGLFRGFIWESGAANVTVLPDTFGTDHSLAFGVNTPAAGNAALITGREQECSQVPGCPFFLPDRLPGMRTARTTLSRSLTLLTSRTPGARPETSTWLNNSSAGEHGGMESLPAGPGPCSGRILPVQLIFIPT